MKGQKWIKLPLVTKKYEPSKELVIMISTKQMSPLLRKKLATRAFVGMVWQVTETVEEKEGKNPIGSLLIAITVRGHP